MDIKEYIQSGIIEQYVLGLADAKEAAELEQLRMEYPELDEAIINFEKDFEAYFLQNPVTPPAHIKSSLQKQLFGEDGEQKIAAPAIPTIQAAPVYNTRLWKYLAAASVILLIVSTALNFYFYSGYKTTREEYQALLTERNTLQANNASYQQSLQLFQDTAITRVELKGVAGKEQNLATVLWNRNSRDVYISVKGMQPTPAGKQYQLWAIVNNQPVSVGVIGDCGTMLCKMESIANAQAFAITLEKEGGSPTPTLTEMYVIGNI